SSRTFVGSRAAVAGTLPVSYPNTWLRLQRIGDSFTGFASYDGLTWKQLGTVTPGIAQTLYLGMAVSSHNSAVPARAEFRDLRDVTNAIIGKVTLPNEPLGPSSRKTGLAITEIMYHPLDRTDLRDVEFIEILNTQPYFEDISGYRISGDVDYTFPPGTTLASGAYVVVAAVPDDVKAVYGLTAVAGPYTNKLSNTSGTVRLRDDRGAVLLEVPYNTKPPWPVAPDGTGHSLVLARPSYGEADPRAWDAS